MAETSGKQSGLGSAMFRDTALRRMSSADDLDRYVKVTNPSAWVLVGAVAALIVAALIWGLTANLPITTTTTGVLKDGEIMCFLPLGDNPFATTTVATTESKVRADDYDTKIISVDPDPYSEREVSEMLDRDYAFKSLYSTAWNYMVVVEAPSILYETGWKDGDDVPIQITTKEVAPLVYLFGGAQA